MEIWLFNARDIKSFSYNYLTLLYVRSSIYCSSISVRYCLSCRWRRPDCERKKLIIFMDFVISSAYAGFNLAHSTDSWMIQWQARRLGHLSFRNFTNPEFLPTIAGAPSVATPTILSQGRDASSINFSNSSKIIDPVALPFRLSTVSRRSWYLFFRE